MAALALLMRHFHTIRTSLVAHKNAIRRTALWSLRIVLIGIALHSLMPAPPRITLEANQSVNTLHPEVCVHTRLTDEVDEWKIQRTLQLVREMGAPTIVEFFPWPYIESEQGHYDWTLADRILTHASNQGLEVIARLGLVPAWARPPFDEKVTTLTYLEEDYFDEFAAFVGAFVARYHDQISGVIIWNEPNLSFEWGSRPVDPEAYVRLLRLANDSAHAAAPEIRVYGGALAPTLEPEDSGGGMNDLRFLERMYEAGAAGSFDVLAVHTYGLTHPTSDSPSPDVINFRRIELLREVMIRYGDEATPMTITESGWNDDPRWANAVRPGERIVYTLEALTRVADWPWVDRLCIWDFRQPLDLRNRRDAYYALVSSDFVIKPIYEALQAYARGWDSPYADLN